MENNFTEELLKSNLDLLDLKFLEDRLSNLSELRNRLLYFKLLETSKRMWNSGKRMHLTLDKSLPQILVPKDKILMFINWWNTNIRFEKIIPKSFNEGYITLYLDKDIKPPTSEIISKLARQLQLTYRKTEHLCNKLFEEQLFSIMYFKFLEDDKIIIQIYDYKGDIISKVTFSIGINSGNEPEIDLGLKCELNEECINQYTLFCCYMFSTIMWYIATTGKNTKYIYTKKQPKYEHSNKSTVDVKDIKFIETPIYDFNKVRVINLDTLNRRKAGWTYSHSFPVHGHYRHYRSGKVVFVNSYIKGKDKKLKEQHIIINPKTL